MAPELPGSVTAHAFDGCQEPSELVTTFRAFCLYGTEQSLIWDQIPTRLLCIAMEKALCLRIILLRPLVYGLHPVNSKS